MFWENWKSLWNIEEIKIIILYVRTYGPIISTRSPLRDTASPTKISKKLIPVPLQNYPVPPNIRGGTGGGGSYPARSHITPNEKNFITWISTSNRMVSSAINDKFYEW